MFMGEEDADLTRLLKQLLLGAAGAGPSTAGASGAGPSTSDGQGFNVLDLLMRDYGTWRVELTSTSTNKRPYPGLKLAPWFPNTAARDVEIHSFLQQQLTGKRVQEDPIVKERWTENLTNEDECKSVYWMFVGNPIAQIASEITGQKIECHKEQRICGGTIADFVYTLKTDTGRVEVLLTGELKTPSVMATCTLFVQSEIAGKKLRECAEQACWYMKMTRGRYGMLSYLNGLIGLKRVAEDEYLAWDTVLPGERGVTILQGEMYLLLKRLEEGAWGTPLQMGSGGPQLMDEDEANDGPAGNTRGQKAARLAARGVGGTVSSTPQQGGSSSGTQPRGGNSGTQRGGGSTSMLQAGQLPGSAWQLYDAQVVQVDMADEVLGCGECGIVSVSKFHGQPVALKAIDLSKQRHLMGRLMNEVAIYAKMAPQQGLCVPLLLGYGFHAYGGSAFLATSVVRGEHPSRSTIGAREAAERALRSIHALGVLHGDVRPENILVSKEGNDWQVWLLDFGHASECTDADKQQEEIEELLSLFRRSEDSTATDVSW